ncbi:MAG: YifB family Mg chelatase-like AAA ATPase [Lachnospiraceae bacterium]|nr:YifB family Mg chelatase-like AAA ATPase [Lachnospiraceae bacterium]NBJ83524.1 ATP-binding protein [bacterium 1XD42-76]NBK06807.1 ATP-binding protein [bacterium 1XD42-94]
MFSKINSIYLSGTDGVPVSVEADVSDGLPGFSLVGYLTSELREAQDRVRTAIRNLGLNLLPKRVTVNLSPADFKKDGTGFDLAIAAAVLAAYGKIPSLPLEHAVFAGELGLDGKVKGIPGALVLADFAKKSGFSRIFLPAENIREAAVVDGIALVETGTLRELYEMLTGSRPVLEYQREPEMLKKISFNQYSVDFSEINGQPLLRRAAEVAAAGMHNLLMIGPAGSGKTMVARRMPTIMPAMGLEESIEISKIYSVSHLLSEKEPLITHRPFRAPHHTISAQALSGGGARPRPGEISLATGGILFLDELPEMDRQALESLRQPLEEHMVTISRVRGTYCFPARFQLVAAMNPCLCGFYPDMERCTCTPSQRKRYLGRISRPLLDRMDICVEAAAVTYHEMLCSGENESSAAIRCRVEGARQIQAERFRGLGIFCNGEMNGKQVRTYCVLGKEENAFMKDVFTQIQLSARTYDRILKVARTAADLEGAPEIGRRHLCEAVSYMQIKERYW